MTTRIIAAIIGLSALIPSLVLGGPVAVDIIVALAGSVCLAEYGAMAFPRDRWFSGGWVWAWVAICCVTQLLGGDVLLPLMVAIPASMVFVTLRPGGELVAVADRLGRILMGIWWIGMLWSLTMLRRFDDGLAWVFLVLAISWLGDTGAYFAGRAFGRTKLYPLVSPKKTWEGVAGGIIAATCGVFAMRATVLPSLTVLDCLTLGPVLCSASVLGDLSESLLKRAFGVKDSGWIMPGHGGKMEGD